MIKRIERPVELKAVVLQREVGCGHIYVTIGHLGDFKPIEVQAKLGKAGGCSACSNEALGRAISIGLQCGVSSEEYTHTLIGLKCPSPGGFRKNAKGEMVRIESCADAIGLALKEFMDAQGKIP